MSGGEFHAFNGAARDYLEPDVGPVESGDCEGASACDDEAVYRVPWPAFGGDVALCPYHLARFRRQRGDAWAEVEAAEVPDPNEYVTRGDRFVALEELPPKVRDGDFRRVGLTQLGYGLYEAAEPDDEGRVTYLLVDRKLDALDTLRVSRDRAGEFLETFDSRRGIFAWDDDVLESLRGGGGGV